MARSIYRQAGIYLFEDIFDQLDNLMSKHLFDDIITNVLNDKTRLFITTNVSQMKKSDLIVYVDGSLISIQANIFK